MTYFSLSILRVFVNHRFLERPKNNSYKPNEFAELINVSVRTLQIWGNEGILKAYRTPTDRRYHTYEQYKEFKGITTADKKTVIYTRVSTSNQKDDLKNQVEFLKQYANAKGIIISDIIEDYGSGLRKYKRKIKEDEEVEKSL